MKLPSLILVIAQFVLIALILSPIRDLVVLDIRSLIGLTLIGLATLLAVWALLSMSSGTFRVLPEPAEDARLTVTGPYQFVRHPMYSAIILASMGATLSHGTLKHFIVLLLLIIVLLIKLNREESFLLSRYEDYEDYRKGSKALIPYII